MNDDLFFSIFSRLVPFPLAFEQVVESFMLELQKIKRLPHVPNCFDFVFYD